MKTADIKLVIDLNTYSGLQGEMKLLTWKKV
jgi:hypothetical protein